MSTTTVFNFAPGDVALVVAGLIRESEQNSEAGQRTRAGELTVYIARRQSEAQHARATAADIRAAHPGFACTCAECAATRRAWCR